MFEVTRKHRGENRQHRKLAKLAISGLDCYVAKHNPTVQEFFFLSLGELVTPRC